MAQRKTAEQIKRLLTEYRDRGDMTREEFCRTRGIAIKSLGYYRQRYRDLVEPVKLARVQLKEADTAGCFRLVLRNGRRIECDGAELARLIRIAEVA